MEAEAVIVEDIWFKIRHKVHDDLFRATISFDVCFFTMFEMFLWPRKEALKNPDHPKCSPREVA